MVGMKEITELDHLFDRLVERFKQRGSFRPGARDSGTTTRRTLVANRHGAIGLLEITSAAIAAARSEQQLTLTKKLQFGAKLHSAGRRPWKHRHRIVDVGASP